jgi:hypothetical protein
MPIRLAPPLHVQLPLRVRRSCGAMWLPFHSLCLSLHLLESKMTASWFKQIQTFLQAVYLLKVLCLLLTPYPTSSTIADSLVPSGTSDKTSQGKTLLLHKDIPNLLIHTSRRISGCSVYCQVTQVVQAYYLVSVRYILTLSSPSFRFLLAEDTLG